MSRCNSPSHCKDWVAKLSKHTHVDVLGAMGASPVPWCNRSTVTISNMVEEEAWTTAPKRWRKTTSSILLWKTAFAMTVQLKSFFGECKEMHLLSSLEEPIAPRWLHLIRTWMHRIVILQRHWRTSWWNWTRTNCYVCLVFGGKNTTKCTLVLQRIMRVPCAVCVECWTTKRYLQRSTEACSLGMAQKVNAGISFPRPSKMFLARKLQTKMMGWQASNSTIRQPRPSFPAAACFQNNAVLKHQLASICGRIQTCTFSITVSPPEVPALLNNRFVLCWI